MSDSYKFAGRLGNGTMVVINVLDRNVAMQLPGGSMLGEALSRIPGYQGEGEERHCVEMKRPVGFNHCLKVKPSDRVFALRKGSSNRRFTPFVFDRQSEPTRLITVTLEQRNGEVEVRAAHTGLLAPPLPGMQNANAASKAYWHTHALVAKPEDVIRSTMTKECPW